MDLLLIRHAIAEDRGAFAETGQPDSERPLTRPGRVKMARAARGLRSVVPSIDVLASSPYVRARQTAEIVAAAYGDMAVVETDTLAHGAAPAGFARWARRQAVAGLLAAVGHEPDLSDLTAWLTGATRSGRAFKKGGACLLSFAGPISAGAGVLRWLLTPRLLRTLRAKA